MLTSLQDGDSTKARGDGLVYPQKQTSQKREIMSATARSRHCRPTTSTTKGDHLAAGLPWQGAAS